jgi:hypothetical protein
MRILYPGRKRDFKQLAVRWSVGVQAHGVVIRHWRLARSSSEERMGYNPAIRFPHFDGNLNIPVVCRYDRSSKSDRSATARWTWVEGCRSELYVDIVPNQVWGYDIWETETS